MDKNQIKNKISALCARKEMCSATAKTYLRKYNDLTDSDIKEIINFLIAEKYIDEVRYANAFVNDSYKYNKWGKYKIIHALRAQNIPETIISSAISTIDEELYNEIKANLAENKRNSLKDEDNFIKEQKVEAFLNSRGF